MAKARYKTRATSKDGVYERLNADTGEVVSIFIKYDGPPDPFTGKRDQDETSFIPDPDHPKGKRHFKNITEAAKYRNKLMNQVAEGVYTSKEMTLADVIDYFFENKVKRKKLSTQYNYKSKSNVIKKHRNSRIKVVDLKHTHISEILDDLLDQGSGAATVNQYRNFMSRAFDFAISMEKINRNPAKVVEPLPETRSTRTAPPPEDMVRKLKHLKDKCEAEPRDYKTRALYYFEHIDSVAGLRIGEMLALQWSDYDFEENCVTVGKTVLMTPGHPVQGSTKNGDVEKVYLSTEDMKIVKSFKLLCAEMLLAQGQQLKEDHFVLAQVNKDGDLLYPEIPLRGNRLRKWHYKLLRDLGIKKHVPHANRHFVATEMFESGSSMKAVQDRLRHLDMNATNIYTHVTRNTRIKEAQKFSEHLGDLGYKY